MNESGALRRRFSEVHSLQGGKRLAVGARLWCKLHGANKVLSRLGPATESFVSERAVEEHDRVPSLAVEHGLVVVFEGFLEAPICCSETSQSTVGGNGIRVVAEVQR